MTQTFNSKAPRQTPAEGAARPQPRLQDICPCYRPKI